MEYAFCKDCYYCKTDRMNEQGQARCTRFSKFVNANDKRCDEYCSNAFCELKFGTDLRAGANIALIKTAYENICKYGTFPNFGSPETRCNKCMFYGIACQPIRKSVAGCFSGWKMEAE